MVTEVAYHDKPTIDADVSFLSLEEWKEELKVLLEDLIDEDGNLRRATDLRSEAGIAWDKASNSSVVLRRPGLWLSVNVGARCVSVY